MKVKIYTDGAARGNPDGREDTEPFFLIWTPKEKNISGSILRDIKRLPITEWN